MAARPGSARRDQAGARTDRRLVQPRRCSQDPYLSFRLLVDHFLLNTSTSRAAHQSGKYAAILRSAAMIELPLLQAQPTTYTCQPGGLIIRRPSWASRTRTTVPVAQPALSDQHGAADRQEVLPAEHPEHAWRVARSAQNVMPGFSLSACWIARSSGSPPSISTWAVLSNGT
jgi:hypothetical protein